MPGPNRAAHSGIGLLGRDGANVTLTIPFPDEYAAIHFRDTVEARIEQGWTMAIAVSFDKPAEGGGRG